MDVYQTEEEQIEALKKWWAENGISIVLGIVLGLAGLFAWRAWQSHVISQASAASAVYQKMVTQMAAAKPDKAQQTASDLTTRFESTEYAVFSKLIEAKIAVDKGKLDLAADDLRWGLKHNSQASMDREIRLRLARVLIAQNKYDEALDALKVKEPGEYLGSYEELRGDIAAKQGRKEEARAAYEQALNAAHASGADTGILETKLDNLGKSVNS